MHYKLISLGAALERSGEALITAGVGHKVGVSFKAGFAEDFAKRFVAFEEDFERKADEVEKSVNSPSTACVGSIEESTKTGCFRSSVGVSIHHGLGLFLDEVSPAFAGFTARAVMESMGVHNEVTVVGVSSEVAVIVAHLLLLFDLVHGFFRDTVKEFFVIVFVEAIAGSVASVGIDSSSFSDD